LGINFEEYSSVQNISLSKNNKIRVIDTGFLDAAENMALDETILELREENVIPDTIRFLSFKPHCVLAGYFQSIENEIRINFCRQEGIEINRRITGGGALYWGTKDIGWEIFASMQRFISQISGIEDCRVGRGWLMPSSVRSNKRTVRFSRNPLSHSNAN